MVVAKALGALTFKIITMGINPMTAGPYFFRLKKLMCELHVQGRDLLRRDDPSHGVATLGSSAFNSELMQPLLLEAKATGLSQAPTNHSRFSRSK